MMPRILPAAVLFLVLPLSAQTPPAPEQKPVAVVNGQTITVQQLDQLYERLGAQMRGQYEKAGGKAAFLENYLRKRLLIQEAIKTGFDKRPDVQADMQASKEATLFDRYVRDVVSAGIVTDSAIRAYYDQHPKDFETPERLHVRHIVIGVSNTGPQARSAEQALEIIKKVDTELHAYTASVRATNQAATAQLVRNEFAQLARKGSEDASAESGGDLGWVTRGQLDADFEAAAFGLPVGVPSGIVRSKFGYHLILVEEKKPLGTEPFDGVKPSIREYLMNEHAAEVMQNVTRLTNDLRIHSKVAIYPENIK
jgi:peptidyl-prolyl cis-trans isomerase C